MGRATAKVVFLFLFAFGISAHAESLKVMSFNTECSICGKENGPFKERIHSIADTVNRLHPDLIAFQEFTFEKHVEALNKMLTDHYIPLYAKHTFYPSTDSTLFVRADRFKVLKYDGVWLGPKGPDFNFGWKNGVPRRFTWATLEDLNTGQQFIFAGTHFDNSFANKNPSAAWAQEWFKVQKLPVIFAGDTNLQPNYDAYKVLIGETMRNTYDEVLMVTATANAPFETVEYCTDVHRDNWPLCRIDHVLLSKNAPWHVASWSEDLFRYHNHVRFASDHRAVLVELETE